MVSLLYSCPPISWNVPRLLRYPASVQQAFTSRSVNVHWTPHIRHRQRRRVHSAIRLRPAPGIPALLAGGLLRLCAGQNPHSLFVPRRVLFSHREITETTMPTE